MQVPWSREWALNWLCLCHWAFGISDCPMGRSRESAFTRPKGLMVHFLLCAVQGGGLEYRQGAELRAEGLADGYWLGKAGF